MLCRDRFFFICLLLYPFTLMPADPPMVVSFVQQAITWITPIVVAAVTGKTYNPSVAMHNYRSMEQIKALENRGVPVGVQNPLSYDPMPICIEEKLTEEQSRQIIVDHTRREAQNYTVKQLDKEIIKHQEWLEKDRRNFARDRKRHHSYNDYAKQREEELAVLQAEKAARVRAKTIHTISTTMVLTSQTSGTDKTTTTKIEKVPEGGNGCAPTPDPDKDPKKGPDTVKTVAGVGAVKTAREHASGSNSSGSKPKESQSTTHATEPKPTAKETKPSQMGMEEFKAHEAKQIQDGQQKIKEARAQKATTNAGANEQPFHEKGLEAKFPDNPGQKDHQFEPRAGHIAERTLNAEKVVKDTIKGEHFDYVDQHGNSRYTRVHTDDNQVWVEVRPDGIIKNCGSNKTHWIKNATTGRYDKPVEAAKDPGIYYPVAVIGSGAAASAMSEITALTDKMVMKSDVVARIKVDPNPMSKLPGPPADHRQLTPLQISQTPEMKTYVDYKVEQCKSMTPQQIMQEGMRSVTTPMKIPTTVFSLPTSTATTSKTSGSTPPLIRSAPVALPATRPVSISISSRPPSIPSASSPVRSSSNSSSSRPSGFTRSTTTSSNDKTTTTYTKRF